MQKKDTPTTVLMAHMLYVQNINATACLCLAVVSNSSSVTPSTITVYSLPNLDVLLTSKFPSSSCKPVHVTPDGRVICTDRNILRAFAVTEHDVEVKIFERVRELEALRGLGQWKDAVEMASTAMDEAEKTRKELLGSHYAVNAKSQSQSQSQSQNSLKDGTFSQAKDALNKRGQKLNELENKFSDLEDSSKDFLSNVQQLTKQMEAKKWYQ